MYLNTLFKYKVFKYCPSLSIEYIPLGRPEPPQFFLEHSSQGSRRIQVPVADSPILVDNGIPKYFPAAHYHVSILHF